MIENIRGIWNASAVLKPSAIVCYASCREIRHLRFISSDIVTLQAGHTVYEGLKQLGFVRVRTPGHNVPTTSPLLQHTPNTGCESAAQESIEPHQRCARAGMKPWPNRVLSGHTDSEICGVESATTRGQPVIGLRTVEYR